MKTVYIRLKCKMPNMMTPKSIAEKTTYSKTMLKLKHTCKRHWVANSTTQHSQNFIAAWLNLWTSSNDSPNITNLLHSCIDLQIYKVDSSAICVVYTHVTELSTLEIVSLQDPFEWDAEFNRLTFAKHYGSIIELFS